MTETTCNRPHVFDPNYKMIPFTKEEKIAMDKSWKEYKAYTHRDVHWSKQRLSDKDERECAQWAN